jgi:branched-chain amino acid transport system ATP-binding protein
MTRDILIAQGLYKSYGSISVLKNVSIAMRRGETHAVIGPNGAGKTTLFKALSGEVLPESGSIEIAGQRVEKLADFQRVRMGVGRTFQVARVFGEDSVLQNMIVALESKERHLGLLPMFSFRLAPVRRIVDEAREILSQMGLDEQRSRLAGVLAYGDRKRLELAMSLALNPKLLMLDEPMAGMSLSDRSEAVKTIKRVSRERGIAVLLTEHDMNVVFSLADQITVLNYGEVIASGSPGEVRASSSVRDVYLGHEVDHA